MVLYTVLNRLSMLFRINGREQGGQLALYAAAGAGGLGGAAWAAQHSASHLIPAWPWKEDGFGAGRPARLPGPQTLIVARRCLLGSAI